MIRIHEGIEVFKEKLEICENESNNELKGNYSKKPARKIFTLVEL